MHLSNRSEREAERGAVRSESATRRDAWAQPAASVTGSESGSVLEGGSLLPAWEWLAGPRGSGAV
jgi:hypothetical protein